MKEKVNEILAQMTLEEKASLCSGADFWNTKSISRLGIPSIMMTDGPIGLRKQVAEVDHLGLNQSVPATCFPSGSALACSWDRELLKNVGKAIAEECKAEGVSILLGPAVNIKRSPLGGRDFEYYSEDPYLSSELGIGYVNGVQSKGVGTSLKHYAANSQETNRLTIDEKIDERALREIYLASFENVVKKAQPWTVMCAYNKINGVFASENRCTLTDILKEEWGHEGFVVSDWGAVNERVDALASGLELEMPSSQGIGDQKIVEAVKSGKLSKEALDHAVARLLRVILTAAENLDPDAAYDKQSHHDLAAKVEEECIILLKNDNNVLPFSKHGTYAVIGSFAKLPRYQGGGSSHINPTKMDVPFEELQKSAPDARFIYADGYAPDGDVDMFADSAFVSASNEPDSERIRQAQMAASDADAAILYVGLPESYESEGFDRIHMRLPEGQIRLIQAVAQVQKHVVLVLHNGSSIEMPWLPDAEAVLETYLGGQAVGKAIADILFGDANPCGKLAETFPEKLSDTPCYINFPGDGRTVEYREGIFVGYRYYDAKQLKPMYPFGYGLSYTTFEYRKISLSSDRVNENDTVTVKVSVKNNGSRAGKEIVELYVRDPECSVLRPVKELKGFEKVLLQPGEEKIIEFALDRRAFAFYSEEMHDWVVESGKFVIFAGSSSDNLPLETTLYVESNLRVKKCYDRNTLVKELFDKPAEIAIVKKYFPEIEKFPTNMLGSMPIRSFSMFSNAKHIDDLLEELKTV